MHVRAIHYTKKLTIQIGQLDAECSIGAFPVDIAKIRPSSSTLRVLAWGVECARSIQVESPSIVPKLLPRLQHGVDSGDTKRRRRVANLAAVGISRDENHDVLPLPRHLFLESRGSSRDSFRRSTRGCCRNDLLIVRSFGLIGRQLLASQVCRRRQLGLVRGQRRRLGELVDLVLGLLGRQLSRGVRGLDGAGSFFGGRHFCESPVRSSIENRLSQRLTTGRFPRIAGRRSPRLLALCLMLFCTRRSEGRFFS